MAPTGPEVGVLEVRLGDVHVGTLSLLADEVSEFVISEEYRQRYPRPVLGQFFEDDLTRRHTSRMRLPPFFANLLPEGPLRELIAEREGLHKQREFFLIARLGEDLPGAVVVTPATALTWDAAEPVSVAEQSTEPVEPLRFSLAGVQLKFSMLRKDRGMWDPLESTCRHASLSIL